LKNVLKPLAFALSISGWLFAGVSVERISAAQDVPCFTNQDIEHYKEPSDGRSSIPRSAGTETKKESAARLQKQKEGEFWCKKARSYQKRIQKDQENVQDIESALEDLKDTKGRKRASLEKKLAKAKKHLGNSEKDLAEFADDAHRKGIPPGWLRCQFD
jgi:hypothetical protein